jgi:hypothetical protein
MKWLNSYRMKLMSVGVVVAVMFSGSAKADFTFGEVVNLGPLVNSRKVDGGASLSADGLTLFFDSDRTGGDFDLYMVTRETLDDDWSPAVNLGSIVNSTTDEQDPSISKDGLTLFFDSDRPGGSGDWDLWMTTRLTTEDDWGIPVNLGSAINSPQDEGFPRISADCLELYFSSKRSGGLGRTDLWVTKRETINSPWLEPVNLGPTVNSSSGDFAPNITPDGLALIFSSDRPGNYSSFDLWMIKRRTTSKPWRSPVNLGPIINTEDVDYANISSDGTTLFLTCWERPGHYGLYDIWQAPILPIVDLNSDGIVDAADVCIMVDQWGTDESLCDIGPIPFGDGIVDVQDLIVLAEHLFEDYRLIAHWGLDEVEGSIVYDSIQSNDGTCHSGPFWVPAGGMIGGALQFDGIDDYVSTPFVLNPGKVSLSVTAWIQGGTPGEVIISQADTLTARTIEPGSTWLGINPLDGRLMTGLMDTFFGPLESESVITDGLWHHVGLVYDLDNLCRFLYVDGVEVARDITAVAGIPSEGGLYFGASQDLDAGTFFIGLIDDVRIYNVTLTADEITALAQ